MLGHRRQQQAGFTPGRSTTDRILALNVLAQRRREYRQPMLAAYVDLKAAFDSLSRPAIWPLLTRIGIPEKIVTLIRLLNNNSQSCVRVDGETGDWFGIQSGVRQGCVLAPDCFDTAIDWVLERLIGNTAIGVSIGDDIFSDLDYADDVTILADLVDSLAAALESFSDDAATLGLELNWRKTVFQSLSDFQPPPASLTVNGQPVTRVERSIYLGTLVHESCRSEPEIRRRAAMVRTVMSDLDRNIWQSRLNQDTKLRLYNTCVLPVFLYGSECWAITKRDVARIDALDHWCLRRILQVKWSDFVTNVEIRNRTQQPYLSQTIARRRLQLFGHVARMPADADVARVILAPDPDGWRRPPGRPRRTWLATLRDDLHRMNLSIDEAVDVAQDRDDWRSMCQGATLH